MMKTCSACRCEKAESEFPKDRNRKDGRYPFCYPCANRMKREAYHRNIDRSREQKRAQNKKHAEKNRARERAWYQANKERRGLLSKAWRLANPDRAKGYQIAARRRHPERQSAYRKKWIGTPKGREVARHHVKLYRYRIRGADGSHTLQEWEEVKEAAGHRCAKCGRKEPEVRLTRDHVIPVSKGGGNDIQNIQPLCGPCNSRKSNL